MAYQEGQRLQGSDGNVYVVHGGVPVLEGAAPGGPVVLGTPDPLKMRREQRADDASNRAAAAAERTATAQDRQATTAQATLTQNETTNTRNARNDRFNQGKNLRDSYEALPEYKNYVQSLPAYAAGLQSAANPAGDLDLVTAYAKVMDPSTGVKEGEAAGVANSDTWINATTARLKNQLDSSGTFQPAYRQALREEMRNRVAQLNQGLIAARVRYKDIADRNGVDPMDVVGEHPGGRYQAIEERVFHRPIPQLDYHGNPLAPAPSALSDAGGHGPDPFGGAGAYSGSGGGGGGGPHVAATGASRSEPVPAANAIINEGIRTGQTLEHTNAQLKAAGLSLIPQDGKNDAAYNSNLSWIKQHPGYSGSMANVIRDVPVTDAQRLAASPGMTGLGSAFNSALLGLPNRITGGEALSLAEKENPKSAFAGSVLGTIPAAAGMEVGAGGLLARAGITGARALAMAPRLGDAAFGAASGSNVDPNAGVADTLKNTAIGTVVGELGGEAGRRVITPLASRAFSPIAQAANTGLERTGATFRFTPPAPALEPGPAQALASINRGTDVRGQLTEAAQLGVPMTLADTSTSARALAGAAIRRSPEAAQLAEGVLNPRARGQVDRFGAAVRRDLGPTANVPEESASLTRQAQAAAGPLYDAAYQAPGASSVDLSDLAQRPSMQGGLRRAYSIAREEGRDPMSLGFDLDAEGNVTLTQVPSFHTLDYVKRGLDDTLEPHRDPLSGRLALNESTRAINATKNELLSRIDAVNPDYAAARQAYAGPVQARDALGQGQDAFSLTPDELGFQVARRTPEHVDQMRLGYRSQLVENANNMRSAGNPFDAASTLGSPASVSRLSTLYPDHPGVSNLLRTAELERGLARTNQKLLGNSDTAERTLADKALSAGSWAFPMAADVGAMALGHTPVFTAGRALASEGVRDAFSNGLGRRAVAKADAIAPIMINPDPFANIATLDQLAAANLARQAYLNRPSMSRAGGSLAAALGLDGMGVAGR